MRRKISYNDWVILENLVDKYGNDNVNEGIGKILFPALLAGGIAYGIASSGDEEYVENDEPYTEVSSNSSYSQADLRLRNESEMRKIINSDIYQEKVDAVQAIINNVYRLNNIPPSTQEVDPEAIVYYCEKHGFDLPLALAQAQQESHFGASPRAKRTKSMFSVGLYDDGRDVCTYESMNQSIEPYIKLVKKNYLLNGQRTVDDILEPGQYYDYKGDRYAVGRNYEQRVKEIRDSLIRKYPVLMVRCL